MKFSSGQQTPHNDRSEITERYVENLLLCFTPHISTTHILDTVTCQSSFSCSSVPGAEQQQAWEKNLEGPSPSPVAPTDQENHHKGHTGLQPQIGRLIVHNILEQEKSG